MQTSTIQYFNRNNTKEDTFVAVVVAMAETKLRQIHFNAVGERTMAITIRIIKHKRRYYS